MHLSKWLLSQPADVQVMAYLRAFAEHFDLLRHIQFRTGVKRIQPLQQETPANGSKPEYTWPRWQLQLQRGSQVLPSPIWFGKRAREASRHGSILSATWRHGQVRCHTEGSIPKVPLS